jgi:vitamin B12 transporter
MRHENGNGRNMKHALNFASFACGMRFFPLLLMVSLYNIAFAQTFPKDSIPTRVPITQDSVTHHTTLPSVSMRTPPPLNLYGSKIWSPDPGILENGPRGNLSNTLASAPSIAQKSYAPGGLSTITLRGTGAGQTQFYWEGLPLNSPMLGLQDYGLANDGLFNELNIFYGGGSLVLGSGGLGGAINLKSSALRGPLLAAKQQYGSFNNLNSMVSCALSKGKFYSQLQLYLNHGTNNFPFHNIGLAGAPITRLQNADVLQMGGLAEMGYTLGNKHEDAFEAKLWLLKSDRNLPPTMLENNTTQSQQDQALRSFLRWKRRFLRGELATQAAYFEEELMYKNTLAGIEAPSSFQRTIFQSEYRSLYHHRKVNFTGAGLRWITDRTHSDGWKDFLFQYQAQAFAMGEANIRFLRLNMAMRQEMYDFKLSPLLGYVGGLFPLRQYSAIGFNVARNYRVPTLNDRFWSIGGNPDLLPEKSYSGEVNFQAYKVGYAPKWDIVVQVGAFGNYVNNWIQWIPGTGGIWQPQNVSHVNILGAEARVKTHCDLGKLKLNTTAQYAFISSQDDGGFQLIYTPRHTAFAWAELGNQHWTISISEQWNSLRYTSAGNADPLKGFGITNINASGKFHGGRQNFALHGGIQNLLNLQYQTVAYRPMPGRSYFIRLDWELGRKEK